MEKKSKKIDQEWINILVICQQIKDGGKGNEKNNKIINEGEWIDDNLPICKFNKKK